MNFGAKIKYVDQETPDVKYWTTVPRIQPSLTP